MTASTAIQKRNLTDVNQLDFNQLYTYEDYCTWQFPERIELIDGVPYQLMSAPKIIHQRISMRLSGWWFIFLQTKSCEVFAAPIDVYFPNPNAGKKNTVVQPDLCIVCNTTKIEEKGISGAPDLVIEILSNDKKRDTHFKFNLYQREGVKEYWVVHPEEDWLIIYTLNEDKKYIGSKHYSVEDEKINSVLFPEFELDLRKLFEAVNTKK